MNDINCWEDKFELCVYAEKLLAKLELLNKKIPTSIQINMKEIKKAIYYAKKYHGEQRRLSGEPYYSHPLEVAYKIADYKFREDILITSILHDTLEDTALTKEMLTCIFNVKITENVYNLTRIQSNQKITAAESLNNLYLQGKEDLMLIKYFDRLHNIETISAKPAEKIYKTIEETIENFISLGVYLEISIPELFTVQEQFLQLCRQIHNPPTAEFYAPSLDLVKISSQDNYQLPFLISQSNQPLF